MFLRVLVACWENPNHLRKWLGKKSATLDLRRILAKDTCDMIEPNYLREILAKDMGKKSATRKGIGFCAFIIIRTRMWLDNLAFCMTARKS